MSNGSWASEFISTLGSKLTNHVRRNWKPRHHVGDRRVLDVGADARSPARESPLVRRSSRRSSRVLRRCVVARGNRNNSQQRRKRSSRSGSKQCCVEGAAHRTLLAHRSHGRNSRIDCVCRGSDHCKQSLGRPRAPSVQVCAGIDLERGEQGEQGERARPAGQAGPAGPAERGVAQQQ